MSKPHDRPANNPGGMECVECGVIFIGEEWHSRCAVCEEAPKPDYDLRIHANPDAMAWTKFFRETNPDCNVPDDIMFGWFANAMMAMHDHITGQGPVVLPDGSAVFVANVRSQP